MAAHVTQVTITITTEDSQSLRRLIPYGMQGKVLSGAVRRLLDDLQQSATPGEILDKLTRLSGQ